ncbi:molybdopterin-guanine dinucleotide biosynthesis protein B [Candidatus Bathyarchaeota archaeon]|nr:MAG: molybdopterin-guanine dinucleotide biosynthesis protein B [Candidatus Bathyarchaeota archaeon]
MLTIAVIGSKSSGKTSVIEVLVRGLTKKGYRVATVKHIPEENFTIDTEGKDTWRHAKAGATKVISVAPNEMTIIQKTETSKLSLEEILQNCEEADIVILEGFRSLVGANSKIFKIVTVKSLEEALEASKNFKSIIAFSGAAAKNLPKENFDVPIVDALNEPDKLVELVEEKIGETYKMSSEGFALYVGDKQIPLNLFVQRMMKSSIIAMASNLKGVEVSPEDRVIVKIKKWGCF